MKTLILILFMMSLSGCAMLEQLQGNTEWQQQQRAERQAAREAALRAERERQEFINNLKPGIAKSEVESKLGAPDRREFLNGNPVYWYDDDEPFFLGFDKEDKLATLVVDTDTINARRTQRRLGDIERQQAWQSFGNQLQHMNTQNQLNRIESNQPKPSYQIPMRK